MRASHAIGYRAQIGADFFREDISSALDFPLAFFRVAAVSAANMPGNGELRKAGHTELTKLLEGLEIGGKMGEPSKPAVRRLED